MSNTWIVYKVDQMDAPGWESRMLMPSEALTDILHEEWSTTETLIPTVGDRPRVYANLERPGHGVTHGRDGDWVVKRVQTFTDDDSGDRVVVCYCTYAPIPEQWDELRRGAPVDEILTSRV